MTETMTPWMKRSTLCLLVVTLSSQGQAFQTTAVIKGRQLASTSFPFQCRSAMRSRRDHEANNDDDDDDEQSIGIPQLPAFGASSFSNSHVDFSAGMTSSSYANNDSPDAAFVSPKFKLQYTCNICETRNSHMVSRLGTYKKMTCFFC